MEEKIPRELSHEERHKLVQTLHDKIIELCNDELPRQYADIGLGDGIYIASIALIESLAVVALSKLPQDDDNNHNKAIIASLVKNVETHLTAASERFKLEQEAEAEPIKNQDSSDPWS